MTTTILTSRRLRLRTWQMRDAQAYNRHCNTEEVMHFLGGPMTWQQVRQEVRWFQRHHLRHGHTFWVVERKRDKAFLGFCGLIKITERDSPLYGHIEIGWRIRADMWRRGYAFEAAAAVMDWAEPRFEGRHLLSRISKDNVASKALARKLWMRRDSQRERDAKKVDPDVAVFKSRAEKGLREEG